MISVVVHNVTKTIPSQQSHTEPVLHSGSLDKRSATCMGRTSTALVHQLGLSALLASQQDVHLVTSFVIVHVCNVPASQQDCKSYRPRPGRVRAVHALLVWASDIASPAC